MEVTSSKTFFDSIQLEDLLFIDKIFDFNTYLLKRTELGNKADFKKIEDLENVSLDEGLLFCDLIARFWNVFPKQNEEDLSSYLSLGIDCNTQEEVVVYGGTFNPFHKGHMACVELVKNKKVMIVIDKNPFKEVLEKRDFWREYKRIKKITSLDVYTGFCSLQKGNPTFQWFNSLKIKRKSLLMGEDSFLDLHKWNQVDELLNIVENIYLVPRGYEKNILISK